jgi:hypothetical protein
MYLLTPTIADRSEPQWRNAAAGDERPSCPLVNANQGLIQ